MSEIAPDLVVIMDSENLRGAREARLSRYLSDNDFKLLNKSCAGGGGSGFCVKEMGVANMNIEIETTKTTVEHKSIKIDAAQLIRLLKAEGLDVPYGATVTVRVPGGGDWSNTDVEVCAEHPVEVRWIERKEE